MNDFISSRSLEVTHEFTQQLIDKLWEGVAARNVLKMAPKATREQHQHTVESFVFQSHAQKFTTMGKIAREKDPIPVKMDNIASGNISVQKQKKAQKSVQQTFVGDRSRSFVSETQRKSIKSNKVSVKTNKIITSQKQISVKKESFFISLGAEEQKEDKIYQKLRNIQSIKAQEHQKLKKETQQKLSQRKKQNYANQKLIKQTQWHTYDYQGDLQQINYGKLTIDNVRKMRDQLGKSNVKSKQQTFVEPTKIENQKHSLKQQRQHSKLKSELPQFSAKTLSIAQALQDISKVAQGVKITDLKNGKQGITLQHKAKKLDGLRQYRLNDFKNIAKQKSFVQFSHTSSKKKDLLDYSASENEISKDLKIKTVLLERSSQKTRGKSQRETNLHKTQVLLDNALGRGLPFIRTKGLRFNDLGYTKTFRTLEPNNTAKKTERSKSNRIRIGDTSLYQQNFFY